MDEKSPQQAAATTAEHGESQGPTRQAPAFQVTAGGAGNVTQSTASPGSGSVAPPAISPLINIDNLADRIFRAIDGAGTDEEQVYLALRQVRGNAAAIAALKAAYQTRHHLDLEADIRDDFSGSELDYALSLLNSAPAAAAPGTTPATPVAPATPGVNRFEAAAEAIWRAVDGAGTDEEAIYAALEPFNRNLAEINQVVDAFQRLHNENLRERLASELSGTEYTYAMHLMAGPAMVANVEMQSVTPAQAQILFDELARLTFVTDTNEVLPVPYHYPPDGCYARAHLMAQRLTELGYASEKVFAVSTKSGGLNVPSPLAADAPAGVTPSIGWGYHVAPIINVTQPDGSTVRMVMDPSLDNHPITIQAWTAKMRPDAFQELTTAEAQAMLSANRNRTAPDTNVTYTTNRDTMYPYDIRTSEDPEGAHQDMNRVRSRLHAYALSARAHDMAAAIRTALADPACTVGQILVIFNGATAIDRWVFRFGVPGYTNGFPMLIEQLRARFNYLEMLLIEDAMNKT